MPQRVFITIRNETRNEEVDLELPGDQQMGDLLPDLLKVLNWPTTSGQKLIKYQLKTEQGEVLDLKKNFREQGIDNFDILWISLVEGVTDPFSHSLQISAPSAHSEAGPVRGFSSLDNNEESPQDRRGMLAPPIWAQIPIDSPSLVHMDKGLIFVLGDLPVTIGRKSRDFEPDIDLNEIDINFLSSRQHAQIVQFKNGVALKPLKTKNGTFLNNTPLAPDEIYLLNDGDSIQFGFRGVQLIFRT